ncbi:hypothetical protein C8J57DRAFT_1472426 [Mycena rebaudengoi]|nr:hypothetical protein C8J57DRAFT_1472426 [Mycena rebaudengoi]
MQLTLAGWLLLSALGHGSLAQTLYYFSFPPGYDALPSGAPTPSFEMSRTISVGGVGADGYTTYVGVGVISAGDVGSSRTVYSAPFTIKETIVAGASGFRETRGFNVETCTFGADLRGACVVQGAVGVVASGVAGTTAGTVTETFTGVAVPFYTIAAATTTGTTPPDSTNAAQRNYIAKHSRCMCRPQRCSIYVVKCAACFVRIPNYLSVFLLRDCMDGMSIIQVPSACKSSNSTTQQSSRS